MPTAVKESTTSVMDVEGQLAAFTQPMRELATAYADTGDPTEAIAMLQRISTVANGTELPLRNGIHTLKSDWTSPAATEAGAAIKGTRNRLVSDADVGSQMAQLLSDAADANTTAAQDLETKLDSFETEARGLLETNPNDRGLDQVIELARTTLADMLDRTSTVQSEHEGTKATLDELSFNDGKSSRGGTGGGPSDGDPSLDDTDSDTTTDWSDETTSTGDPATDAQIALQKAAIDGGVEFGTAVIDGLVNVGTHLVDKIAEVTMHGIDAGADLASQGIDTLAANVTGTETSSQPSSTTPAATQPSTTPSTTPGSTPVINFGAGTNNNSSTGTGGGTNSESKPSTPAPAQTPTPATDTEQRTPAPAKPEPPAPAETPARNTPSPTTPAPAPSTAAVVPPATGATPGASGGEHTPRIQPGTMASLAGALTADLPVADPVAPVIGDHGDPDDR